jgi:cytochrome c-type biogenesis protein CcmH
MGKNWKMRDNNEYMKTKLFIYISCFSLLLAYALVPIGDVFAQQPTPSDDEVNAIAREMFCPICENTPLDVCPTEACRDWRELIRQMLAEGKTSVEIKQYFVDHYGARVLSEPPQVGLNWLVYVVPPVAFLIGAFLLIKAFRTWTRMSKAPAEEISAGFQAAMDNDYSSRIEEELRDRK